MVKIDVAGLKREVGGELSREFTLAVEPIELFGDTVVFEPARVGLKMYNVGDSISAFFDLDVKARLRCSRCLETFSYPISSSFQVTYRDSADSVDKRDSAGDEDIVLYSDDLVDVSDDVRQQIVVTLPMKPVCADDCKGLCTVCGQNLNVGLCGCAQDEAADSRWTALGELLKKD